MSLSRLEDHSQRFRNCHAIKIYEGRRPGTQVPSNPAITSDHGAYEDPKCMDKIHQNFSFVTYSINVLYHDELAELEQNITNFRYFAYKFNLNMQLFRGKL